MFLTDPNSRRLRAAALAALPGALTFLKSVSSIEVWLTGESDAAGAVDSSAHLLPQRSSTAHDAAAASVSDRLTKLLFRAQRQSVEAQHGDGAGPQAHILSFIAGAGKTAAVEGSRAAPQVPASGPASLDAFFQRLESSQARHLPRSCEPVRLTLVQPAAPPSAAQAAAIVALQLPQKAFQVVIDETWLVANVLGAGTARQIAVAAWKAGGSKMIPWAGVAARLPGAADANDATGSHAGPGDGQPFCFLPLPGSTGLPCSVNGFFELSSNRWECMSDVARPLPCSPRIAADDISRGDPAGVSYGMVEICQEQARCAQSGMQRS